MGRVATVKAQLFGAVLVLLLMSSPANSTNSMAFESGDSLMRYCGHNLPEFQTHCRGYIAAVGDVLLGEDEISHTKACIPGNVSLERLRGMTLRWLEENPDQRQFPAQTLVATAMSEAFPCDE